MQVKDYSCNLVVSTEREKFLVPVVALGNRALLLFPDAVSDFMAAMDRLSSFHLIELFAYFTGGF